MLVISRAATVLKSICLGGKHHTAGFLLGRRRGVGTSYIKHHFHYFLALQLAKENSLSALEKAIQEAKKQCDEAGANECASAWDTVEELSAAIAHKKAQVSRPTPGRCGLAHP